jgi:hypothetical protein
MLKNLDQKYGIKKEDLLHSKPNSKSDLDADDFLNKKPKTIKKQ